MILVTGATGHIGNVLVRRLIAKGERVRGLIWRGEDTTPLREMDVEQVEGDVLDPESLNNAVRGVDKIFHLAGLISIMPGADSLIRRVNVEGTRNMLAAALKAGVSRFIYTSSIHAIRRTWDANVVDEQLPFDPDSPYGAYDRSKAEASLEVQKAAGQGLDAVIVCPTGVIGPYDYRLSELGNVIKGAAMGGAAAYVDGAYDFVDVRDVADGLILASEKGQKGESYILSGQRTTVRYLLETVREATGRALTLIKIPFGLAELAARFTPYYYMWTKRKPRFTPYSLEVLRGGPTISHGKATRALGYAPRSLYESIVDTARWFRENRRLFQGGIQPA